MRKRIGIFGATEESLRLVRLLRENPDLEIVRLWDAELDSAAQRARVFGPDFAAHIAALLTNDVDEFITTPLDAVVASDGEEAFWSQVPSAGELALQVVSPLTARLLWGYGVAPRDRKTELLQALNEVVESVDLTAHSDEIFARMLEIAVGVTGADGGSLMLLDPERRELSIRTAIGVEPELWSKIRVRLGDGIAGRVAADARPLRLRGKADRRTFQIVRERFDVESALSVPLVYEGGVLGVLNLHHSTQTDAFDDESLSYLEQLAQLDAKLIARTQAHEALRNQAARFKAVREVQEILGAPKHLAERLHLLCEFVAGRVGDGIATVYLYDADESELRLAATSLKGGGFGGEYRILRGHGIDGQVAELGRPTFLHGEGGTLAYAALPLQSGERLVGVLTVQTGTTPPRGRAAEETLLEISAALADGVAQVDREARIAARATRVNAINETGIRMLSATEVSEVARLATSSGCLILEADHAVLRLQDEETLRYVIRSYYGSADGRLQEKLFRLDKQLSVDVIKRRSPLLVRDLHGDSPYRDLAEDFRSTMAAPLKRDGQVIGTLCVYDKVAADQFYTGRFNDDDLQICSQLVSYIERALDNAHLHNLARQHRNFDDETGLPNTSYLSTRIGEEIARAAGRQVTLAIATCRIENSSEITAGAHPAHGHRVIMRTAEALRTHIRDFDVLGRTGQWEFSVLMPEPGHTPETRVVELARSVADAIAKDDALNDPIRIALCFGHALYPRDGEDWETLLSRSAESRIHMV